MEDLKSSSCSSSNICRSNESDLGESNSAAVMVNNHLTDHTGGSVLQNKKFLVIANVSKKPNMKTLIYSAAAHDFNVAIVGLPNMDISDLHIADKITGTNHSDLMSRDGWRNNNNSSRSNCTTINQADSSSSTGGEQENMESSNQQESGLSGPSSHRISSESINSTLDNVTNSSSRSSSSSSSSSSKKVTTDNQDNFPSSQSGSNTSNTAAGATVMKNFCSILRFETLKELKSFLESKEIKLFGIEIMDEGKNYASTLLNDYKSFFNCV
jgi:trimeric autotransporter adhesin